MSPSFKATYLSGSMPLKTLVLYSWFPCVIINILSFIGVNKSIKRSCSFSIVIVSRYESDFDVFKALLIKSPLRIV